MRKMSTAVATSILAAWIGGAGIAAQSDFNREWSTLVERLDRTHITGDVQGLMDARADCRRWMEEPLTDPQRQQLRYAIAYANWRLLAHPDLREHDDRDDWGDEAVDAAQALDGSNPRFLLLKGIDLFHRPERFGGGAERAEAWFRSAAGFFDAQPADQPWPDWGRAEAHAWLGRTLARLGDEVGARENYEAALAIEPDFSWVREGLLPDLNR